MLTFNDMAPGQLRESDWLMVTADEIGLFAEQHDPIHGKTFDIDGRLIASPWLAAGLLMRLFVEAILKDSTSMGSPGIDELHWRTPLKEGDRIRLLMKVTDCIPSRSKPDRGLIKAVYRLENQLGECIIEMRSMGLFGRRIS